MHKLITDPGSTIRAGYVPEGELRTQREGRKVCDGLLIYGSDVVALEVKASLLTVEARSGADWYGYVEKLEENLR